MQIKFNRPEWLPIFTTIASVADMKSSKPILECIKFDITDGLLILTASNNVTTLRYSAKVECSENTIFSVHGKKLTSILKSLAEDFTFEKKDTMLNILSGSAKFSVTTTDADDFPNYPVIESKQSITLNDSKFTDLITKAVAFTSDDNLRAVLTAVYLESSEQGLNIVSTDSVRLFAYKTDIMVENVNVMLPKGSISQLKSIKSDNLTISIDDNVAEFVFGNYRIMTRLINGSFPKYQSIIPKNNEVRVSVKKSDLLDAISRISLVANPVTRLIKLKVSQNSITVQSEDSNSSSAGSEEIACVYDSTDFVVGYNFTKLTDCLKAIDSDDVVFCFAKDVEGKKPSILRDSKDENILILIMPSSISEVAQ